MKRSLAARTLGTFTPGRRAKKLSANPAKSERELIPGIGAGTGAGLGRKRLIDVKGVGSGIDNNISPRIGYAQEGTNVAISVRAGVSGHDEPEFAPGHIGPHQILNDIPCADTQSANRGVGLIVECQTEANFLLPLSFAIPQKPQNRHS